MSNSLCCYCTLSSNQKGLKTLSYDEIHQSLVRIQKDVNKSSVDQTIEEIWKTSKQINKTLEAMFGCVFTVKKMTIYLPILLTANMPRTVLAATNVNAEKLRKAFSQVLEIVTAVSEPILWFYAITALIMIATGKNKMQGKEKLKCVIFSYVGITLLPTLFTFLRWFSEILKGAISF